MLGIDASPRAIGKAMTKARRGLVGVEFLVADVFTLEGLGRRFASALDCGCSMSSTITSARLRGEPTPALEPGGELHLLCQQAGRPDGDRGG